jgi:hypothetical protein
MTTAERKRWWRIAALAVVGGGVITGGWYRLGWATPAEENAGAEPTWTRAIAPAAVPAPPAVADVERAPSSAPVPGPIIPVGGTLPVPAPSGGNSDLPPVPVAPAGLPALPAVPPIEPVTGPRAPDAGLVPTDKAGLPAIPAAPVVPPVELPALPVPPKPQGTAPVVPPMPAVPPVPSEMPSVPPVPPLSSGTPEPPKALPPMPVVPAMPSVPTVPQPALPTPPAPLVNPAELPQPMLPAKPDSGLNPPNSGNTLNPTVPALPPITPPTGDGRQTPGTLVDRPKPPETKLDASDKFVFPVPVPKPLDPHLRDDPMFKLTATAAFAIFGGAMLAADQAKASFPTIPSPPAIPVPGTLVKDDKMDIEKLKTDLEAATKKIADANKKAEDAQKKADDAAKEVDDLKKKVATLTELLNGRKDPFDPGAVAQIKDLNNKIKELEKELAALKTQTTLKPSVTQPEVKPTGVVKIINEYPVEITIVVNGASYRVGPSQVKDIEVPAGDFTYQLLTAGAPSTKSAIQKGETVRLRIK